MAQSTGTVSRPTPAGGALRRWPSALGVALAAWVALDLSEGADLGPGVVAMAVVYLGAAALGQASAAWLLFALAFVVVLTSQELGGDAMATWVLIGMAVPFVGHALVAGARSRRGPDATFPRQTAAMVGFAVVAVGALALGDDAGAYVVAAGLLAHAAWDGYHHRRNEAVVRSYAEFCSVLDVLVAAAVVVATARG
jgi:hypothetical protein